MREEDQSCSLSEISNALLSPTILMVGINVTEGNSLLSSANSTLEGLGVK